jgi:hypothetical protein
MLSLNVAGPAVLVGRLLVLLILVVGVIYPLVRFMPVCTST